MQRRFRSSGGSSKISWSCLVISRKRCGDQLLEPNTSPAASVERICAHAYALGLRLPSEMTVAMIITLAYQTKVPGMTGHEKFKLLEKNKPVIKKLLSGSAPRVFLTTLPAALEDFPWELNEVAFPAGTAPAPQPLHMDFGRVARSWPMRWSNRLAAAGSTPGVLDRPDHSAQEATLSRLQRLLRRPRSWPCRRLQPSRRQQIGGLRM